MELADPYREFIIDQIAFALTKITNDYFWAYQIAHDNLNEPQEILINTLLDWYPKFTEGKHTYENVNLYKKYHKFSYDAFTIIHQKIKKKITTPKGVKEIFDIHGEHNPPKRWMYRKILFSLKERIIRLSSK